MRRGSVGHFLRDPGHLGLTGEAMALSAYPLDQPLLYVISNKQGATSSSCLDEAAAERIQLVVRSYYIIMALTNCEKGIKIEALW